MTADLPARIKTAVDEARKTAEAATPGPWWREGDNEYVYGMARGGRPNGEGIAEAIYYGRRRQDSASTAEHIARFDPSFALRLCDHADDVLARHRPGFHPEMTAVLWCCRRYPCPDVRALATAWLGDGWES